MRYSKRVGNGILFVAVFMVVGLLFFLFRDNSDNSLILIEQQGIAPVRVVVTAPFLADMVNRVGGSRVVTEMITPSDTPHFLERSNELRKTQVLFMLGDPFDSWARDIGSSLPSISVVSLSGVVNENEEEYPLLAGGEWNTDEMAMYYWLSPRYGQRMLQEIARQLGLVGGVDKEFFLNRAYEYTIELVELQREFLEAFSSYSNVHCAVQEGAFEHMMEDFRLTISGVVRIDSAASVSVLEEELVSAVNKKSLRVLVLERNAGEQFRSLIERDTKANVALLEPLGNEENKSYEELLRYNFSQLLRAFR